MSLLNLLSWRLTQYRVPCIVYIVRHLPGYLFSVQFSVARKLQKQSPTENRYPELRRFSAVVERAPSMRKVVPKAFYRAGVTPPE